MENEIPMSTPNRVDFGTILSKSWEIFKNNYKTIIPLVYIVYVPIQLLSMAARSNTAFGVLAGIAGFVGPFWIITCICRLVQGALNSSTTLKFKEATMLGHGWVRLLGTQLLQTLIFFGITMVGGLLGLGAWFLLPSAARLGTLLVITLVYLVILIYLGIAFTFVPSIVPLTDTAGMAAMKSSMRLVRGRWWRVFGYSLLFGLMVAGASAVAAIPFGIVSSVAGSASTIADLVISLCTDVLVAFAFVFSPVFYLLFSQEKGV